MNFSTPETLSYCEQLVRSQRRDWFLASMYLPLAVRRKLYALYALEIELAHVHHVVSEEMIGHIRYAWWQEQVEALHIGRFPQGHPVFQELIQQHIEVELLLPLVEYYRECFPEMPSHADVFTQNMAHIVVESQPLVIRKKWEKATALIARHRMQYGETRENWLLVKLLFA